MFFNPILNTLPYRGKIVDSHKRRGKPLRYNLSSLRDLPVAKFLPDINNIYSRSHVPRRVHGAHTGCAVDMRQGRKVS